MSQASIAITLIPPQRRRHQRPTAPMLLVLEWLVLTTLGAVALSLATG